MPMNKGFAGFMTFPDITMREAKKRPPGYKKGYNDFPPLLVVELLR
jgi:hypothetical protein